MKSKLHIFLFTILFLGLSCGDDGEDDVIVIPEADRNEQQVIDNDSLLIQMNRIDDIENKILTVKRESIVSNNPNKWRTFNVDDSLGLKLTFYGFNNEVIGSAIFGRSSSDWQRSYVRMVDGNEVYMTNENVLNRLQMRPTFWGSKPPPPVSVEPDSL